MQEKQIRLRLQAINAAIAEGQPREAVFRKIVDAVHALGFDRVRLDLLSADGRFVAPVASRGFDGEGPGEPVLAKDDKDLLLLSRDARPHVLVEGRGCVPVLLRERVVGKLCVENARSGRLSDDEDLWDVLAHAQQAALVLARSWTDSLETLQRTTLAIASVRDRDELLRTIVEQAVKLLGAKSGGLYEYRPEQGELVVIADYNRPEQVGRTLKTGEGMAGRLIASGERFVTTPDYYTWEGRAEIYGGRPKFGAVLEVPLVWEENVIGVLYVDDEAGRSFSETEARLLNLFADQAAICLTQTALLAKDAQKLQRLERLAQVTQEMMGNLDVMSWRKRLEVIARSAAEVLEAETTGVFRVRGGELVLEASFGQRGEFEPGTVRLKIHNENGGGLTGWIAYHGELFNKTGESLTNHPATARSAPHTPSGHLYSLVAIPLTRRVGEREEVIGLIRADNKQGEEGQTLAAFTSEDERILTIFAEAAVIAIESAELVDRLKEQREFQERLISSSPDGIIAVDRRGRITEFNQRAEEILGYSREEVLGQFVSFLYVDPNEVRRIGRMLHESSDHEVIGYETAARSKAGERIPILHASTWLFNAEGERVGSVGYFEDLRERKALERRESLLLRASNVVAREEILDKGLQRLADMMVELLGRSFCCIWIMEEDGDSLILRAASRSGELEWNPGRQRIDPAEWPGLPELMRKGLPTTREWSNPNARPSLERLSRVLRLEVEEEIRSLLIVPLKIGDRVVGQLDLGDLQRDAHAFPPQEIELVAAIAAQITVLVDRMELLEKRTRNEQLLKALVDASVYIRGEMEMASLFPGIVRQAAELAECRVGGLFIHRSYIGEIELAAVYGLPEDLAGQTLSNEDGLLGQVARQGVTGVHAGPPDLELFPAVSLRTVAAVPLKGPAGEVEAVLFVGDPEAWVPFGRTDREILEDFATQAAIALRTSQLMGREQRFFSQLAILHRISNYIQAADKLEWILLTVLTGVTASFGLGFNRAMLMLLDETGQQLVGEMGVGYLEERDAREAWKSERKRGATNFESFRLRLEAGEIGPTTTTVGRKIRGLRIPAHGDHLLAEVLSSRTVRLIGVEELVKVPREFLDTFRVTTPLAIGPLVAKGQVIGLLVVDNKFTQAPITMDDLDALMAFAATAAVAIDNKRLFDQVRDSAKKLISFYQMSSELISIEDPLRILSKIVEQTEAAAGASWVSILLIDEAGRTLSPIRSGRRSSREPRYSLPIRPEGISMRVLRTGEAFRIENVDRMRHLINPELMEKAVQAALCLPLSLPGKRLGVMWIHYDEPRRLPDSEVAALQLYVNQAAIAYDSARRIESLEALREFSNSLAEADDLPRVLRQIVEGARRVLKTDHVVLWVYDEQAKSFIPENSVYAGDHASAWSEMQKKGPRARGTAFRVMSRGWLLVEDVQESESELGPGTQQFLTEVGGRGFLGGTLKVGRERLGVFYAVYSSPFQFNNQEQETAETFASQAALFLKKARLFEQVQRAQNAAEVLARLTLLEDQKDILKSVVREIWEALDCGAVVLFQYDQDTGELILPPAMAGGHHPPNDPTTDYSLVLAMMERDGPYVVSDVARDERFKDSRFTQAEGIKAGVAIPLKAMGRRMGVMFIAYRNPRKFTADDLTTMELFANQAAVAIRNTQLFGELETKLAEQETLAGLSRELLGARSVQETTERAVEYAARTLDTELSSIVLPDREGRLLFSAAMGWQREVVGNFVFEPGEGSQTGYTIQQRMPVATYDYSKESRFKVPPLVFEHQIHSGLSVPMFLGGEIVGAMLVHTRKTRRFNENDGTLLSLIANQTAIALERARQYEASQRKSACLAALYEVSKAITAQFGLERRQILEQVIQPAIEGIVGLQGPQLTLGTIEIYDEDRDELIMESIYPPELSGDLVQRVGERRGLRRSLLKGEGIGIVGRAVITGQPQLVRDVLLDPDYVAYRSSTRSELAVPLIDRDLGKVIGVLNVESDQTHAFGKEDQEALQTLAELAVIAIQNARRIEELRTQTTLAWMGLGNAVGRHELSGQIGAVLTRLHLLGQALEADNPALGRAEEFLGDIERRLQSFSLDRPTGQANEGLSSILVNEELIDAFHRRFLESHRGWRQRFTILCELEPTARIVVNRDWLFRVLDILVNNAAQAGARNIVLGSRPGQEELWIEIYVADDGHGIPEAVRSRLLREPIREGSKGLGTGLLIAQEVVRSYGGSIRFEDRKPRGTIMVVSLPEARN